MARPLPTDLEDALAANPAARDHFWALPAEGKDQWVSYVERARFPGARRRRIAETVRRLGGVAVVEGRGGPVALPSEDWSVWLIGLALLAGLAAFLIWLTVFHNKDNNSAKPSAVVVTRRSTVPKVTGIRYQSAQFQLKDAKLTSALTQKNSTKPKGIVIAQKPDSGKSVLQGTEVALVVSKGPSGVAMPDVTGMAAADAVKALAARKLVPTLQQVESQEAPGTVLAQSPTPGKHAKPGTKVILQVAKGHASISVPDVTGHSAQDAVNDLKTAGLSSSLARVPSSQPAGTVVAQNPAAGTKVAGGSAVRLNVATARATTTTQQQTTTATTTATKTTTPATTTKPPASGNDYTGMKLNDAVQQIADGRQQVIVQYVSSSGAAGVVVANSRSGSKERLQVSTGSKPKAARSVPDTTGEDAQTAQQDLQSAGFTVIQVTWPVGDASSDGMVVYQAPSAGSSIPQGSAIVVYVGSASGG